VYSGYSYVSDDDKAVAVVKFTQPWGSPPYRAVLVYGDMIKVKGGLRERVALTGYILSYLVLPDKAYSRLDIIKPRYKRKRPAKGVVVGFSRDNDGSGRGSIVLECVGAIGVFAEYRAKYVVFIPPIIAWRFSRWVKFEPRRLYELEGCKRIEREVAGEA
ncbi:MAG: hypothetical protein F7C35_05145, partial [Desulfurococcales archaeon]|nr:hypothetical protein [Desulfurococcales archaeon]